MREGASSIKHRAPEQGNLRWGVSDNDEALASERRDRGFGLLCIEVFFFYKHLCIGVCFAFALYRLYWGLVFSALSASDVTVGTMGLISDSLCCCCCFYFLFFILNLRVFLILWLRVLLKHLKYNFFFKFFSAQGVPGSTLTYTWRHHCDKLINWWLKFTTNSKDKYLWIFLSLIQL